MTYLRQKTEPATEKSPTGKIAIPMKKLCTTEIIPSAPQNISPPPPPIISTSLENSTATFRNILTTQACNHLNHSLKKLPTFPENLYRLQKQCEPLPKNRNS